MGLGTATWVLLMQAAAAPAAQPQDCDEVYEAAHAPADFGKALACFRAHEEWDMVAIMLLNGEGTPVDVPGARAAFKQWIGDGSSLDGDQQALDRILRAREAKPAAKARRIVFCRDVAQTTISASGCDRREEDRKAARNNLEVKQLEQDLDPRARPPFASAVDAFGAFVKAESARAYQQHIDGSIRGEFAIAQEALARRNFMASLRELAGKKAAAPPAGRRSFVQSDRELNATYRDNVHEYADGFQQQAADFENAEVAARYRQYGDDYKKMSRAAQHEWVRYRDAMGQIAAARWPEIHDASDRARARVTEDRIRELRNDIGGGD